MSVTSLIVTTTQYSRNYFIPFYIWRTWGSERLRHWPQITHLVSGRAKIRIQSQGFWPTYVLLSNPINTPEVNALVFTITCFYRNSVVSRTLGQLRSIKWNPNSYRQGTWGQEVKFCVWLFIPILQADSVGFGAKPNSLELQGVFPRTGAELVAPLSTLDRIDDLTL